MDDEQHNNTLAEIDANASACVANAIFLGKVTKRTYNSDANAQKNI